MNIFSRIFLIGATGMMVSFAIFIFEVLRNTVWADTLRGPTTAAKVAITGVAAFGVLAMAMTIVLAVKAMK